MIAFNTLAFYFHLISHCLFGALTGRIYLYAWIAVSTKICFATVTLNLRFPKYTAVGGKFGFICAEWQIDYVKPAWCFLSIPGADLRPLHANAPCKFASVA
jgi:hypothetical protein